VRVLIILLGAVGDVTRGLIIPRLIKDQNPAIKIAWLVEPISASIVRLSNAVDEVIVFNRTFRGIPNALREIRKFKPDVTLDLQRHFKSGFFSFFSRARRRIGFHPKSCKEFNWLFNNEYIEKWDEKSSKQTQYIACAEKLIGQVNSYRQRDSINIPPPPEFLRDGGPYVGLILGSAWESKDWSGNEALLDKLKGHTVVLIGSKSQEALGEKLVRPGVINTAGKTSLADVFGILSVCKVVIGPDSGPGHMASLLEVPYIALFGPTDPVKTAPKGSLVVSANVPCAPCYRRKCPGLGNICMRAITPEVVFNKALPFLN
jgi:ADP-heptose:LPS heptosyltransferase